MHLRSCFYSIKAGPSVRRFLPRAVGRFFRWRKSLPLDSSLSVVCGEPSILPVVYRRWSFGYCPIHGWPIVINVSFLSI